MTVRLPPWEYRDRWALVTGASAGLGVEFAEQLAARGMHLVLTARRQDRLAALAARLEREHGIRTAVIAADLAAEGEAERVWREASTGREIHLLVNNAGFGARGLFDAVPLERHLDLLRVNATAPMVLAYRALQAMKARGAGAIINVSSITAFQPVPMLASYGASKAFLLSLSEALWAEAGEHGVRVLALCPGRTPTEFQEVAGTGPAEGAFGFRTPRQVIEAGLRALERGDPTIVPGFENRAAAWVVRVMPRSTLVRVMKSVMRKFSRSRS